MMSVVYVCQQHVGKGKWKECEDQLAVFVQMFQLLLILIG